MEEIPRQVFGVLPGRRGRAWVGRAVSRRRRGTCTPRTGFRLLFPPGGWGCRGHNLNRRVERVVLSMSHERPGHPGPQPAVSCLVLGPWGWQVRLLRPQGWVACPRSYERGYLDPSQVDPAAHLMGPRMVPLLGGVRGEASTLPPLLTPPRSSREPWASVLPQTTLKRLLVQGEF